MNTTFSELGLSEATLSAIEGMGYTEPSSIQSAAIPVMLSGKDLIGQAQTGTGKTTAFGAPIIQMIEAEDRHPQALIMCPTRELALQVSEELKKLAKFSRGIQITAVYGGESIEKQIKSLRAGSQIVVGTPGRIMDHIDRGTLKLGMVGIVVLDEADEMLDMGFREDIESILESVPDERQTVLFSATMPPPILAITRKFQHNPELIKIATKSVTVSAITQYMYDVKGSMKLELMTRLIEVYDLKQIMVFCNTKSMVDELTEKLNERGYDAEALHGDLRQNQRTMVLNKFKKGKGSILVATDVAARGIDVDNVEAVFNYDTPNNEEAYVHRIGRTGRAGKSGLSFTFCSNRDNFRTMESIVKYTKAQVIPGEIPDSQQLMIIRQKNLKNEIFKELSSERIGDFIHMAEQLQDETLTATMALAAMIKLHFGDLPTDESFVNNMSHSDRRGDRDRGRGRDRDRDRGGYKERNSRSFSENRNRNDRNTGERSFKSRGDQSSRGSSGMSKIFINLGKSARIRPGDLVGAIAGETGLSGDQIGHIEIHENFSFVEVPKNAAKQVAEIMTKSSIRGKSIVAEIAKPISK